MWWDLDRPYGVEKDKLLDGGGVQVTTNYSGFRSRAEACDVVDARLKQKKTERS